MRPGRDVLHGPSEEDRRAVEAAAARRRTRPVRVTGWTKDEALALAAADHAVSPAARALAWLVWAYNRAPPRALLDAVDWPLILVEGVLPPLGRWLAFRCLPAHRIAVHVQAAQAAPNRSSGWAGCLVVLVVWAALTGLAVWAFA